MSRWHLPGSAGRLAAPWVRGVDAGSLLETFLVWAVVTIVVTRLYLELMGYPQLGGGGFHISEEHAARPAPPAHAPARPPDRPTRLRRVLARLSATRGRRRSA